MIKQIICQQYGGLGDDLVWTTLPELFSKNGHDVYIKMWNIFNQKLFNPTK
jgi:hypothetical protein